MTGKTTPTLDTPAVLRTARARQKRGLAAWLAQERVFRLIPFVMVEGMFLLLLAVPFILTIYISLLKWRANRPFEQAMFQGLENYLRVLTEPEFWWALGRTFYFAGTAVGLELLLGFLLAMLVCISPSFSCP
jgi:ABC-type sugar transport system permease subunit